MVIKQDLKLRFGPSNLRKHFNSLGLENTSVEILMLPPLELRLP